MAPCFSQPNLAFPDAPWHRCTIRGSQPSRRACFGYRVMRRDGIDLIQYHFPEHDWCTKSWSIDDDFMRTTVAYALAKGSQEVSPFLHCCATFEKAFDWYRKATSGGEIRLEEVGYIVRIDLTKVGYDNVIDLSTPDARDSFFANGADGYTELVRKNYYAVRRATEWEEILIC